MKVSLDGGITYQDVPQGVRVLYENVPIPGEDEGELHVNHTDEGIIFDVWCDNNEIGEDYNIGTDSTTTEELVQRLVNCTK